MAKTKAKPKVEATNEPKKKGRPTIFNDELALEILTRLESGESLLKMCQEERMPNPSTVHQWKRDNPVFSNKYTQAKENQLENRIDNIYQKIDKIETDNVVVDELGNKRIDTGAVALSRLYIDTLKWDAGKQGSKKFREKIDDENKKDISDALNKVSNFIKDLPN